MFRKNKTTIALAACLATNSDSLYICNEVWMCYNVTTEELKYNLI